MVRSGYVADATRTVSTSRRDPLQNGDQHAQSRAVDEAGLAEVDHEAGFAAVHLARFSCSNLR